MRFYQKYFTAFLVKFKINLYNDKVIRRFFENTFLLTPQVNALSSSPPFMSQKGGLYNFKRNLIEDSSRSSGLLGDQIKNITPNKLGFCVFIRYLFLAIIKRQIFFCSRFAGPWFSHFGHFLLESFSRLQDYNPGEKLLFHPFDLDAVNDKIQKFQISLLEVVGIDQSQIKIVRNDPCLLILSKFSPEVVQFPLSIKPEAINFYQEISKRYRLKDSPNQKLFFSRNNNLTINSRVSNLLNLEVENLFKKYKFQIIHPELLSIENQISLVSNAQIISGFRGSAMHLAIFASPGTPIMEFGDRELPGINTMQLEICNKLNLPFIFEPYDNLKDSLDLKSIEENIIKLT